MKIIKINIFILTFFSTQIFAQVKLQPEVGLSYMPYKIYSIVQAPVEGNSIDLYFGINGKVKFNDLYFMNVRVGRALRHDANIKRVGFNTL